MKQGDLITVALPGDYGKPRPALVIQSDRYIHLHSVTVLPLTSHIVDMEACRVVVEVSAENQLQQRSQIMVEKITTIFRVKAGSVIGHLSDRDMIEVNRALAIFLGFA